MKKSKFQTAVAFTRKVANFAAQSLLMMLLTIGVVFLLTSLLASVKVKEVISLKEQAIAQVKTSLDFPDTAVFSEPQTTFAENIFKLDGHFTAVTKEGADPSDMVFTVAMIEISPDEWKTVHLSINGRVYFHTLSE